MKKVLILVAVLMAMGCAGVKDCPSCAKCPPSYAGLYEACEASADRLEDALSESDAELAECRWILSQRKSVRLIKPGR